MSQRVRRILLVSYYFPPAGGVSVQRMLALSKYLPRDRCEVGVLTTWNGAYPVSDPALLARVPNDVRIHRVFTPELPYRFRRKLWDRLSSGSKPAAPAVPVADPKRGFGRAKAAVREQIRRTLVPDPQVVWAPFAEWAAARLIKEHGYDTVVVTAPPYSALKIGNALKQRFPALTLVSDFRDDWFGFYLGGVDSMASEYKRQHAKALERETVERSDLVVAVTQATRDDIRQRYPEQPDGKFQVIPNGYDPATLPEIPERTERSERMVVTYVGTVYKPCSPRYFLDALDSLPEEVRSRIDARFVGRVIDDEKKYLEHRKAKLTLTGFVAQDEALRQMAAADYLLLIIDDPQTLSGKLFEYLATRKPILGLADASSESGKLVLKAKAGELAPPRDVPAIRQLLLNAYERFQRNAHQVEPDLEQIRRFERPRLANEYLTLIESVQAEQPTEATPLLNPVPA